MTIAYPTGKHLLAGTWIAEAEKTFIAPSLSGVEAKFPHGSIDLINKAVEAAEAAFSEYSTKTREERAVFLEVIAEEIEKRGAAITEVAGDETGLPAARLEGERGRTTGQLRLFASHIRKGEYLDLRHDPALPDRKPLPRPDLRLIQRPIGPVAVFGASNFPLAFSVAGGDTAAALAAGCPVVVKGHGAHPGTGQIVAGAIDAAIKSTGMPAGVFSFIHGGTRDVGKALVQHPLINAVGFTGSLVAGRELFNLCAARPVPIPFFGELGSINPLFVLPGSLSAKADSIAEGWIGSLTLGAGQFCTNPGILAMIQTAESDKFIGKIVEAAKKSAPQTMLTPLIASACKAGTDKISSVPGVK